MPEPAVGSGERRFVPHQMMAHCLVVQTGHELLQVGIFVFLLLVVRPALIGCPRPNEGCHLLESGFESSGLARPKLSKMGSEEKVVLGVLL